MRRFFSVGAVMIGVLLAAPARADIALTIDNGRVTLVAKDVTVAQILAEWARVGQTQIVNAERLMGPPVTLELSGVTEEMALGIILRSASGYLAGPRAEGVPNTSRFNRILIMPTSTAPRPSASPPTTPPPQFAPPPFQQPSVPQPSFVPPFPPDDATQEQDLGQRDQLVSPNPRGPVFQTFPMPQNIPQPQPGQQVQPGQNVPAVNAPSAASPTPVVPVGVAVPGMPVPVPTPQQPGQPPQPQRRPGA